ncbi:MAG: outer membrane protein assembly factor BamA [Alphaproteobacteria bacterium]
MTNKIFFSACLFLFFFLKICHSQEIIFKGLNKLNTDDLETLTDIDFINKTLTSSEVSILIKDFYNSDLIYDLSVITKNDKIVITIDESKIIKNIFFNGNRAFNDADLEKVLKSKKNFLLNKDFISKDLKLIRNLYLSRGFNNFNINANTESFSNTNVNLILDFNEGNQSQITKISFAGNKYFSDRYLNDLIKSRSLNFYNFLSSGSNFNRELFEFDLNIIKSKYNDNGFFNAVVNYELIETSLGKYHLKFYINESERAKLSGIKYDLKVSDKFDKFIKIAEKFSEDFLKNDNYYNFDLTNNFIDQVNDILIYNNIINYEFTGKIIEEDSKLILYFTEDEVNPIIINKIEFRGNSITKDKTLRSKLPFLPGDYVKKSQLKKTTRKLNNLPFINNVNIEQNVNDNISDLTITIDENKKTGSVLAAASFSGDTGAGFSVGLKDYNILGTGNEINSSFNLNTEQTRFDIKYSEYPLLNPNLRNDYLVFNQDQDYTDSFGYKTSNIGFGYNLNFRYNENTNLSSGFKISSTEGHSPINNSLAVTDNIGSFEQLSLNMGILYDTTNDILYPTNGVMNKISAEVSPSEISDYSYFILRFSNDIYLKNKNSNNFFFISNDIGLAESPDGNLKTINAFSLGGLNFKGFDYRGIGQKENNVYLGGNKFYTSTIGYGGLFIFDKKDNLNFRTFYTMGSLWDNDYSSNDNIFHRSSIGVSLDILTPVFPLSLTYAIPLEKKSSDITREFNFSLGTSF